MQEGTYPRKCGNRPEQEKNFTLLPSEWESELSREKMLWRPPCCGYDKLHTYTQDAAFISFLWIHTSLFFLDQLLSRFVDLCFYLQNIKIKEWDFILKLNITFERDTCIHLFESITLLLLFMLPCQKIVMNECTFLKVRGARIDLGH